LAAWFAGGLDKEIKNCLDDEDSDVSRAAVKATIRRRQQDMAHEIATQLQTEQDFTRKCCLLDDLIATADLGETFRTLPKQIRSAINLAHPFLKDDAFREIERLRKKNCELLAKEKR